MSGRRAFCSHNNNIIPAHTTTSTPYHRLLTRDDTPVAVGNFFFSFLFFFFFTPLALYNIIKILKHVIIVVCIVPSSANSLIFIADFYCYYYSYPCRSHGVKGRRVRVACPYSISVC